MTDPWLFEIWSEATGVPVHCWWKHSAEFGVREMPVGPKKQDPSANPVDRDCIPSSPENQMERSIRLRQEDLQLGDRRTARVQTQFGSFVVGSSKVEGGEDQDITVRTLLSTNGAERAALVGGLFWGLLAAVVMLAIAVLRLGEQRLRTALQLAASGQLANYLTHGISNRLTAIQNHLPPGQSEGALGNAVNDLMSFCIKLLPRLHDSSASPNHVRVKDVVDRAWGLYKGERRSKGEGLHFFTPIDVQSNAPDVFVLGELDKLALVVANLLENAEKATRGQANAEIILRTSTVDQMVLISVIDNGPGLPQGINIFALGEGDGKSTGLGLTLARHTIEYQFKGKITAANRPEGGAVVTISLPLVDQS